MASAHPQDILSVTFHRSTFPSRGQTAGHLRVVSVKKKNKDVARLRSWDCFHDLPAGHSPESGHEFIFKAGKNHQPNHEILGGTSLFHLDRHVVNPDKYICVETIQATADAAIAANAAAYALKGITNVQITATVNEARGTVTLRRTQDVGGQPEEHEETFNYYECKSFCARNQPHWPSEVTLTWDPTPAHDLVGSGGTAFHALLCPSAARVTLSQFNKSTPTDVGVFDQVENLQWHQCSREIIPSEAEKLVFLKAAAELPPDMPDMDDDTATLVRALEHFRSCNGYAEDAVLAVSLLDELPRLFPDGIPSFSKLITRDHLSNDWFFFLKHVMLWYRGHCDVEDAEQATEVYEKLERAFLLLVEMDVHLMVDQTLQKVPKEQLSTVARSCRSEMLAGIAQSGFLGDDDNVKWLLEHGRTHSFEGNSLDVYILNTIPPPAQIKCGTHSSGTFTIKEYHFTIKNVDFKPSVMVKPADGSRDADLPVTVARALEESPDGDTECYTISTISCSDEISALTASVQSMSVSAPASSSTSAPTAQHFTELVAEAKIQRPVGDIVVGSTLQCFGINKSGTRRLQQCGNRRHTDDELAWCHLHQKQKTIFALQSHDKSIHALSKELGGKVDTPLWWAAWWKRDHKSNVFRMLPS